MRTLEFTVEQKQLIAIGDIYVDVDIRLVDKMYAPRNIQEKLVVDKLNSELGALGYQIKQLVKEQIIQALTPTKADKQTDI